MYIQKLCVYVFLLYLDTQDVNRNTVTGRMVMLMTSFYIDIRTLVKIAATIYIQNYVFIDVFLLYLDTLAQQDVNRNTVTDKG